MLSAMTEPGRSLDERVVTERTRVLREYRRRTARIDPFKYSPMNPAEAFMRDGRRRTAFKFLRRSGLDMDAPIRCLEIGYGTCGWLVEFLTLGVPPESISGIELDEDRAAVAMKLLPTADLRVGNAVDLPWPDESFQLVLASTVFSSVLDDQVQEQIGRELLRVLAPEGVVLVYDFSRATTKAVHDPSCPTF